MDPLALAELPLDEDPPKAPLLGALRLTHGQEMALTRLIMDRLDKAGRGYRSDEWLEKRNRAMRQYEGDMKDRKQPGTIFDKSNMTLNLPKRYARITAAKVFDDMLSGKELVSITEEGKDDQPDDAKDIQRYCNFKLEEASIQTVLREAELLACIRGETVVKTTWKRSIRRFRRYASVLLGPDNNPVVARDGNFVTLDDTWIDDPETPGKKTLARDPRISITEQDGGPRPVWKAMNAEFRRVTYEGLDSACLDHRDFVCNTTEKCVQKADMSGILMDLEYDAIEGMLLGVAHRPETQEFLQRIRQKDNTTPSRESARADADRGEEERSRDAMPTCAFAEVYLRIILEKDGIADEICVLIDTENEQLAAYEYLDNISPTGFRPVRVVRMEPVPNRWYGTGYYELFADRHKFCDLFLNRLNFAAGMSGNIKIENPNATEEGMIGEAIEFGSDKTYRLRDGYTVEDVFKVIPVPFDAEPSKNLLDLLLQVTGLESGNVSAGDSGLGDLPASNLATGIRSLERIANVLLKNTVFDLVKGMEGILTDCCVIILRKCDLRDVEKLMGPEKVKVIQKYRDTTVLPYKVKIILASTKDADVIAANKEAFGMLLQYESLLPEARSRLRPVLIKILQTLGIDDVQKAVPDIDLSLTQQLLQDGSQPESRTVESTPAGAN